MSEGNSDDSRDQVPGGCHEVLLSGLAGHDTEQATRQSRLETMKEFHEASRAGHQLPVH